MFNREFISICKDYAEKQSDVLSYDFEDTKKVCKYIIEFYSYIIEFRYVKKESVFFRPSSLYCVIRLRKSSIVYYHLTDIIPHLQNKTFSSCYFWNIETPERLKSCFDSLIAILENITSQLDPFLMDDSILQKSLFDSYKTIYNLKEKDSDFSKVDDPEDFSKHFFLTLQNTRDGHIFSRYCNFAPYALLLKNKTVRALKKYEKLRLKNKLLEYEKALISHITESGNGEFCPFEESCDTSASEQLKSTSTVFKQFALVFSVFSIIFCGIFAVYNLVISSDALFVLSAPWYSGFLCALLCSVFGAIALLANKPVATKRLTQKESADFSKVMVSSGTRKLSVVAFALSVIASVAFAVVMLIFNVRFYGDSIAFDGNTYNYDDIDSVYYIEARYNVYDERIERGSYVILFDDKTSLDLDGYTSVEFTEKEVLPLLREKGISIKTADSEKELPWYATK